MLLVRLEIIATTYRSTIFKTHLFSLYSHLCIYVSTHLHTVYLDWLHAVLECNSWCAWRWWSSELRDTPGGRDCVNSEMHLEAVIKRGWRCTGRPWSSELRDALGGRNRARLVMHLEGMNEGVWRYTWKPRSCELGRLNRASLEMHLYPEMEWTQRCTWRPWSSEFGDALGCRSSKIGGVLGVMPGG